MLNNEKTYVEAEMGNISDDRCFLVKKIQLCLFSLLTLELSSVITLRVKAP